jgi:hypothetical protein
MHIKIRTLLFLVFPVLILFAAAFLQWGLAGLLALPQIPELTQATAIHPYGFPNWLRITHYINFLLIILLIRNGLQILADDPRLYWGGPLHSRCGVNQIHAR